MRRPVRLTPIQLEDRTVPALVVAPGVGETPNVKLLDEAVTGKELGSFLAYDAGFLGGVSVATGDLTGDGVADIVTGSGVGASPHVKVFDGSTLGEVSSFLAYDADYHGGLKVVAADVTGDGIADIITGTSSGTRPHVKVFDGVTREEVRSFWAYDVGFNGGLSVAASDIDDDGFADIVTGAGAGAGPHVKVFSGRTGEELRSFLAYDAGFRGGVMVTAGDLNKDGIADIVTAAGAGATSHIKVFDGATGVELSSFHTYSSWGQDVAVTVGADSIVAVSSTSGLSQYQFFGLDGTLRTEISLPLSTSSVAFSTVPPIAPPPTEPDPTDPEPEQPASPLLLTGVEGPTGSAQIATFHGTFDPTFSAVVEYTLPDGQVVEVPAEVVDESTLRAILPVVFDESGQPLEVDALVSAKVRQDATVSEALDVNVTPLTEAGEANQYAARLMSGTWGSYETQWFPGDSEDWDTANFTLKLSPTVTEGGDVSLIGQVQGWARAQNEDDEADDFVQYYGIFQTTEIHADTLSMSATVELNFLSGGESQSSSLTMEFTYFGATSSLTLQQNGETGGGNLTRSAPPTNIT